MPRPRLAGAASHTQIFVIVGPAGSGKTVLATQIADSAGGRVAWCRLAPGYGRAADLVDIAAASLGAPTIDDAGRSVLDQAGDLLALMEEAETTLVVDDFHEAEAACEVLLAEVIPLLPSEGRVIVVSRSRPAGLLGRLGPGAAAVVEAGELAFTDDEAADLLGERAAAWVDATGGWAACLGVAASAGDANPRDAMAALVRRVLLDDVDGEEATTTSALAALPYATGPLLEQLGLGSDASLGAVARRTLLVTECEGMFRLHDVARPPVVEVVGKETVHRIQREAGRVLAASDPTTAIDLLVDAEEAEAAADVLADNLSGIGLERAVHWLYRLPAELRHRFPPVLAAGRATVDLDVAIAEAERRVEAAADHESRREALFALGSVCAGRGELAEAADALDAALAGSGADALTTRAATWLGLVRYWAGDLAGAAAALERAGEGVWAHWGRAQVALDSGDLAEADRHADAAVTAASVEEGATEAPGRSIKAVGALLQGDFAAAAAEARAAYQSGVDAGGFDLACGAVAHTWVLLEDGAVEEALAVCDTLETRVARHDMQARVQGALIRLAAAQSGDDREETERCERRVHDLRQMGYAPLERLARQALTALREPEEPLVLLLLGRLETQVDGAVLPDNTWRSKKAMEVLRYLATRDAGSARREEVIEAVWPGRPPDKGRHLLRTALADMRRALEPGRQAGEPSRFLEGSGERVVITAVTDLGQAEGLARAGDHAGAFALLAPGLAQLDEPAEWWEELGRYVSRLRSEAADRVASDDGSPQRVAALETMIDAEPWRKDLYDRLATLHRGAGDEAAARAVERRWFEDDDA